MKQQEILAALLAKYEKSSHLLEPGKSHRRVMLNIDKANNKDFPQYNFENAAVRDAYNSAAKELEAKQLISIEWLDMLPRMQKLILNLDNVDAAYDFLGRLHPQKRAAEFCKQVHTALEHVNIDWIKCWQQDVLDKAAKKYSLPDKWDEYGELLLRVFQEYAQLQGGTITMRAFSIKCFHDSKRFEREFKDRLLKISARYDEKLQVLLQDSNEEQLSWRAQLAYLGIYARPELYELSGRVTFTFAGEKLNLGAVYPQGLALPDKVAACFTAVDLSGIERIIFIENKTNYDEFLQTEIQQTDLVIYHGGMLNGVKRKFFARIAASANCKVLHWSDIDLGGMEMFAQLHEIIPQLKPWRMDIAAVEKYHQQGLTRPAAYWQKLDRLLSEHKYPEFEEVIHLLLKYKVTIEQESFLL